MADALLPLAGVVLGVVASYVATSLHERATFRRSMAMRWDDRRIETYIGYTTAVKEAFRAARRVLAARSAGDVGPEVPLALEAAEARRSLVFESVVMLGSKPARDRAAEVNEALWDSISLAEGGSVDDAGTQQRWLELERVVFERLNAFHEATRVDLGVEAPRRGPA